jgi:integrase
MSALRRASGLLVLTYRAGCGTYVPGWTANPKGLRHTFGVAAFQAGTPPHFVQRWLGHASSRTTVIYGAVTGREERAFAAQIWKTW